MRSCTMVFRYGAFCLLRLLLLEDPCQLLQLHCAVTYQHIVCMLVLRRLQPYMCNVFACRLLDEQVLLLQMLRNAQVAAVGCAGCGFWLSGTSTQQCRACS